LRAEVETEKNKNYDIGIKMTSMNKSVEILKRDHGTELERMLEEQSELTKVAYEELVLKHNDERNRLI